MKKALVVGINNYPQAPLMGCINDAISFANIIETNGNGSPNFSVKLELDNITQSSLRKSITTLFQGDSDTVLFYFSGHGFISESGGYIVTPDFEAYNPGVFMDEILTLANLSSAKNIIVILDCCFSGAFGATKVVGGFSYLKSGMTILASSLDNEASFEINGHGIFTSLLLNALTGGAADVKGDITSGSIYAYIDQALGPWKQRPVYKTNVSRFLALRTIEPKVPLNVLRKISYYFPNIHYNFPLNPTFEFDNKDIAIPENVVVFQELQKMVSNGLVVPVDEEFMYYAAQNSKACRLTSLGHHYWRLAKEKLI
jgi:hypothetical protein